MHGCPSRAARFFPRSLTPLAALIGSLPMFVVATGLVTPVAHAAEPPAAGCSHRYEDAVSMLDAQRYAAAFACLSTLADRGDPKSARMALALLRYRPTVADGDWSATLGQQQRWRELADAGGGPAVMSAFHNGQ